MNAERIEQLLAALEATKHYQPSPELQAKIQKMMDEIPRIDRPEEKTWMRLPRAGTRCPVSGLSRTGLIELCRPHPKNDNNPPVEAKILRRKGTQRGVLLINRNSLLRHIDSQPNAGMENTE